MGALKASATAAAKPAAASLGYGRRLLASRLAASYHVGVSENGDTRSDAPSPTLQQILLAGIGWASEGIEAADTVADDLARRVGVDRDSMRAAVSDAIASWRKEAERLGVRGDELSDRALARLGLARREEVEDLDLRVAQLEHRLRLLEG